MSKVLTYEYRPHVSQIPLKLPDGMEKIIEINPGWAFGTGNHITTKLCIRMLENLFKERKIEKVLDVGCGSGVLAICAVALGAGTVLATDIEAGIAAEAESNARRNGFSSNMRVSYEPLESIGGTFDLVSASILTDVILSISGELKSKLKPNGLLLVSGIHDEQKEKEQVIHRFKELGLSLNKQTSEDGWVALLFRQINNA